MVEEADESLPPEQQIIASRAANEGIPIGAIARFLQRSFGVVGNSLKNSLAAGVIGQLPKADWPPTQFSTARLPTVQRAANIDDIEFACRQNFRLTPLEAAFLVMLLRYQFADKDKLHGVIEQQRAGRHFRLDKQEVTDPKMVDVMICKLRAKLKKVDPALIIQTSWGQGYYIEPAVKDAIYAITGAPNVQAIEGTAAAHC